MSSLIILSVAGRVRRTVGGQILGCLAQGVGDVVGAGLGVVHRGGEREYINAVLYVVRTGCPWRHLPHDFAVEWSSTHKHFLRWCRKGLWRRLLRILREESPLPLRAAPESDRRRVRLVLGQGQARWSAREASTAPRRWTASNATSPSTPPDSWVAAHVTTADVQHRAAFPALLTKTTRACFTIRHLWLDKGYTGPTVAHAADKAGVAIDIVSGPKPAGGFKVHPRRWVVERTNGWINHSRRLVRQYETSTLAHKGFLTLSQIALLLRRLDRGQLFDTP